MAQALRFCCAAHELLLHGDRQRKDFWGHAFDQQRSNRPIQISASNALTGRLSLLNLFVLTEIIGHDALASPLMIAHAHPFSTLATDDESLQKRRPFPWRRETLRCV